MSDVSKAIDYMITVIKNTSEYQTYLREKEKVCRYPELMQQINDYRIKTYDLQNRTDDDDELFHKIDEYDRQYEKFKEDPLVADFLQAELDFCRMMQDITRSVTAALDFD